VYASVKSERRSTFGMDETLHGGRTKYALEMLPAPSLAAVKPAVILILLYLETWLKETGLKCRRNLPLPLKRPAWF